MRQLLQMVFAVLAVVSLHVPAHAMSIEESPSISNDRASLTESYQVAQKAKRTIKQCTAQGGSPCGAQYCCLNGWRCGDNDCHPPSGNSSGKTESTNGRISHPQKLQN